MTEYNAHGFWPTSEHRVLLRAALLGGAAGATAFGEWSRRVDLDTADGASVRLLPLLYRTLLREGYVAPDQIRDRLRGVFRQAWYRNQLLLSCAAHVLRSCQQGGVPVAVLKGVPLGVLYYDSLAERPMTDVDLLVAGDASSVARVLAAAGLAPRDAQASWPPRFTASMAYRAQGDWEVDVHRYVMHECRGADADASWWNEAVPLTVGGVASQTLCAEDHVLHAIGHGLWRNALAPIRWVADVVVILRRSGATFRWDRLYEQARLRRLTGATSRALHFVHSEYGVDVPDEVLARFRRTRLALSEQFEYRARMWSGAHGLAAVRVVDFLRSRHLESEWRGPLGFPRYVRDTWGLESAWHVPVTAVVKATRRWREGRLVESRTDADTTSRTGAAGLVALNRRSQE